MDVGEIIRKFKNDLPDYVQLVAVSKMHPATTISEAYKTGQRDFGENKVQELLGKFNELPKDIQWHLIGHLQTNKVKYIAPFVHLIHSVDSLKLLQEINKQALKNNRVINCLLQIYIAREETKFGLNFEEAEALLVSAEFKTLNNVSVTGLMGMATNTVDHGKVKSEFHSLSIFFKKIQTLDILNFRPNTLSMGMSSDYRIAIEEGSNMIRIGSFLFGERNYSADFRG
jgi:pyridoxal phosphate enzyme (YggS family)